MSWIIKASPVLKIFEPLKGDTYIAGLTNGCYSDEGAPCLWGFHRKDGVHDVDIFDKHVLDYDDSSKTHWRTTAPADFEFTLVEVYVPPECEFIEKINDLQQDSPMQRRRVFEEAVNSGEITTGATKHYEKQDLFNE